MTTTSAKKGVQQFLSLCKSHGLKKIVFSPGSRSAPLVLGFANNDAFETYIIPDERSAAFYALGMAEELNEVVAVVCTSGSALLNYYPAISEAFYRNIPLMIISADRPLEWTDQGDGQTIRQEHVFQNHILAQTTLFEAPKDKDQQWFNQRETSRLFNKATSSLGGPVHINFPFSEPLYEIEEVELEEVTITTPVALSHELSIAQQEAVQHTWNSSPKKLILCGQMPKHPKLLHELKQLAKDPSVAIVVENTSNLQDRAFNHCIDRTLNTFQHEYPALFQPDLMITIGGAVISKKIKKYLRTHLPKTHWKVGFTFPEMDTYQCLTHSFEMDPATFIEYLSSGIGLERGGSRYGEQWKQLDYQIQDLHHAYLQSVNYSDLAVFDLLMDAVPDQAILHLANSSVVRYAQLFDALGTITYRCNRGTSGIDGSMSTAIGSAIAEPNKLHVIITGDISFFYDSNAFWNNHVPSNVRVFLINNNGGGIFSIIPGPMSTMQGADYFVTSNKAKAEGIADAFGLNYYKAKDLASLDNQLQAFYGWQDNEKAAIMEIVTPKDKNAAVLDEYWEKIKVEGIKPLES